MYVDCVTEGGRAMGMLLRCLNLPFEGLPACDARHN